MTNVFFVFVFFLFFFVLFFCFFFLKLVTGQGQDQRSFFFFFFFFFFCLSGKPLSHAKNKGSLSNRSKVMTNAKVVQPTNQQTNKQKGQKQYVPASLPGTKKTPVRISH